ncbi:MAG: YkgJ family cysteine cluster protein [Candidatus Nitrospinota bacterium M3_3B_026]
MTEKLSGKLAGGLIGKFRENAAQTEDEILRKNWRSIACMTCGACCCSDVIPIMWDDFERFHKRLGEAIGEREFAALFLKDPDTAAPAHSIEVSRYGGRCMFLSKGAFFECAVWEKRPRVCAGFYCLEMTNFEKWEKGEEQDSFDKSAEWGESFASLLYKVVAESPLSFFASDMARYLRLSGREDAPSFYETARELFEKGEGAA